MFFFFIIERFDEEGEALPAKATVLLLGVGECRVEH